MMKCKKIFLRYVTNPIWRKQIEFRINYYLKSEEKKSASRNIYNMPLPDASL